jgi:transglutaminase-like putative cysteine protease
LTVLHTAVLLFAAYHFAQFVAPILSLGFLVGAGVVTAAGALVIERRGLRLVPGFILFAALVAAVRGALEILALLRRGVGDTTAADAMVLFLDTNAVAALPVVLVLWFSVFLLNRRPRAYRVHPVFLAPVLLVLFWTQGRYNLTLYDHPLSYAFVVAAFAVLELAILLVAFRAVGTADADDAGGAVAAAAGGGAAGATAASRAGQRRHVIRGAVSFLLVVIPLVLLIGSVLYTRYAEGSTARGGGLLEPTLFRFDFSDYLRLESEISLSDDLVLFLKKPPRDGRSYLRRYVLSAYDARRGFYRHDGVAVPNAVGNAPQRYEDPDYRARETVVQELYHVNFDPDSLVALNHPVRVVPYRAWPEASFSRVYQVTSRVSTAGRLDLVSVADPNAPIPEGRAPADLYTADGDNEAIAELAREITEGIRNPHEQVAAIEEHLRTEYFYSLSPGVAADGDQLNHFLFESRKGYCSYFAFAMALMVRSLDIPARVAVGFFVDPRLQVLDFHVVRADMAHAWVEVYFDEYGWIEFDPTSEIVAPGEDVEFGADVQVNEIASLLQEILENRDQLEELSSEEEAAARADEDGSAVAGAIRLARRWWWALLLGAAAVLLLLRHGSLVGFGRPVDSRSAVIARYRRLLRTASYLGRPQHRDESIYEHADRVGREIGAPLGRGAELYLAALFARDDTPMDSHAFAAVERAARRALRRSAAWQQRVRFVLFPFGSAVRGWGVADPSFRASSSAVAGVPATRAGARATHSSARAGAERTAGAGDAGRRDAGRSR